MSEILRRPWIFDAVSSSLNPQESQGDASQSLAHFKTKSQLVQIVQFILNSSGTTHILANLSDKFHYIVAFFTSAAIGKFAAHNPTWRITDLQGSIIRLKEFKFVQIPTSPGAANNIVLVVEEFELVGSQGSATFGDPRYIMNNQSICQMLEEQGSKATSQLDISFSENLDPADLLFLETTCTQTLERVRCSFPQVIKDSDWIIPDDQLRILENVDYGRLSKFEFQSDTEFFSAASSDIEASPVKRQQRSPQRAHTANESLTFTQAHSLPAMTQPFTQNSLVRGSQSPAKIRIIENLSPASPGNNQRKNRGSPVKESSQATTLSQFSGSPKRTKLTDEPVEPTSSQKTLPVRFPSSPERKPPASPPRNALVEFPDYSAW